MAPRLVQLQLPAVNPEEEEFEKQDTWKLQIHDFASHLGSVCFPKPFGYTMGSYGND